MVHSLTNKRRSQSAVALLTLTHGGVFDSFALGNRDSIASPAEGAVCNPTTLAVGWGNPDLNTFTFEINLKSPFGFQVDDFAIANHFGLEWINDYEVAFAKDEFWAHPKQVGGDRQECCNQKIKKVDTGFSWVEHNLHREQCVQGEGQCCPDKISLGAKDSIHASIIAVCNADGEGNKND